jgi:propionate CoA-transferase
VSKTKIITAAEAAAEVKDGMTITVSGFVGSVCPESLSKALEKRYLDTGSPKALTLYYCSAQGNRDGSGAEHFAHGGLLRKVIGGHWNLTPKLGQMARNNEIEAYALPQGTLSQLTRAIAGGRPGVITHVGLDTFVDPRLGGGKLNAITKDELVHVIGVRGKEQLLYESLPIDIGFLRGTYADERGNVTLEREPMTYEATSLAQAVKNSGGKVFVQVEKIARAGGLDPRLVKIPGIYVDGVVEATPGDHEQCFGFPFNPALTGEIQAPLERPAPLPLDAKKIIARRAALELRPGAVCNLGIGAPEYIALVAAEEGLDADFTLTVEAGVIGGSPLGGARFGACANPECILSQPEQFDFYDGGGLDQAFLGLAEVDEAGNLNVSRFGPRIAGPGGFINITQNAKNVYFCGTFTAGGLELTAAGGKLSVTHEGQIKKFVRQVEQITFSGRHAQKTGQPVMYITERAVFALSPAGMVLTEIAPGIDLGTQVLDLMDFSPIISPTLKTMDAEIFRERPTRGATRQ